MTINVKELVIVTINVKELVIVTMILSVFIYHGKHFTVQFYVA